MLENVPGYEAAVSGERNNRLLSFLGVDGDIGGLQVEPLKPRHLILLEGCGSAFLGGYSEAKGEIARFVWIVSPEFVPDAGKRARFYRRNKRKFGPETAREIVAYISRHLQDAPGFDANGTDKSYYSWAAALVDHFGERYGWSVEYTLGTPLGAIYQLLNVAAFKVNPDHIHTNPSDRLLGEYLKGLNKG